MAAVACVSVAVVSSRFSMIGASSSSLPSLFVAPMSAVGPTFDSRDVALSDTSPPTRVPVFCSVFECVVSVPPAIIVPLLAISPAVMFRFSTASTRVSFVNVPDSVIASSCPAASFNAGVIAKSPSTFTATS
ncbi:hypothetical protein PEP31012_01606 [Pandoraea eparura]|uniref:Uncharacterized protein n=1 Tax=Pandoraea eparura TaxID=2508291 RepID=A0A5E4TYD2_9BURK|nr:hypothetical protein PEP31012_01606 [Pandoraea eparura]